jgi:multicomponent K+:H+ antiporter subunit D
MFFVAAIGMTGLPPLSGFVGKLLILDAARSSDLMWWIWGTILIGSLVAIVGFSRAGSIVFWKAHQPVEDTPEETAEPEPQTTSVLPMVSIGGLLALLVAITVGAGPVTRVLSDTSEQLFNPESYIAVVLTTPGKVIKDYHGEDDHGTDSHGDDGSHGSDAVAPAATKKDN